MTFAIAHELAHIQHGHLLPRERAPEDRLYPPDVASLLEISDEMNEELAADAATFVTCYNLILSTWMYTTTPPKKRSAERFEYEAEYQVRALHSAHRATEACQAYHSALCILGMIAWRRGEDDRAHRLLSAAIRSPLVQLYIQREREGRMTSELGPFLWTDRDVEHRKAHDTCLSHFTKDVMPETWSRMGLEIPRTVPDIVATERFPADMRENLAAHFLTDLEERLAEQVRTLGNDHPDVLDTRHELAQKRGDAGDAAGAASAYAELVTDAERVLGADHVDTLAFRNNLASWLGDADDASGAAAVLDALLPDLERVLGPAHAATIAARTNLSIVRRRAQDAVGDTAHPDREGDRERDRLDSSTARTTGEGSQGEVTSEAAAKAARYAELLGQLEHALGPEHPKVLKARQGLVRVRAEAGDLGGAVAACVDLLVDLHRVLGPDHHDTFNARNALAQLQGDSGDYAGAASAYAALIPDAERALGADHPLALATRLNLAMARGMAGDAEGAVVTAGQTVASLQRVLGPDHPHTLTARHNLASMRGRTGDTTGAVAALEEVLADQEHVLGLDHPDTLNTRSHLAAWRER
ncbi:tetratricopeptide repeat protein [Streptomyces niveus]|uniref:tetratricopeptide repeat protein n=1 Tax=Streptomyces niveus TaxID=193462 RepID=UPI0036D2122F